MKITTVIPALVDSIESESLLFQTIAKIPKNYNSSLILITQGRKPNSLELDNSCKLSWIHIDYPMTKWEAIRKGQKKLSDTDEIVALLDADDTIESSSLTECYENAPKSTDECVLGRRTKICLQATDAFSDETRFILEIFSNTLLLILLKKQKYYQNNPPDIQNCLYILNAKLFNKIDLSYVGKYGGELALFFELSRKKVKINNIDIVSITRKSSHYNINDIVQGIMGLPFFFNVRENDFIKAKELATSIYKRYFTNNALQSRYWKEIDLIIQLFEKYSHNSRINSDR